MKQVGLHYCITPEYTIYDTVYLRALKRWRYDQLKLPHGTETKKIKNTKNKKQVAQKKRSGNSSWRQSGKKCEYTVMFTIMQYSENSVYFEIFLGGSSASKAENLSFFVNFSE